MHFSSYNFKRTDSRGPRSVHIRLTTPVCVNGSEPGPFLIHTHVTLNPGYTILTRFTIIPFISCNTMTRVLVYTVSASSTIDAWIGITVINVYKLETKTKSLEVKTKGLEVNTKRRINNRKARCRPYLKRRIAKQLTSILTYFYFRYVMN